MNPFDVLRRPVITEKSTLLQERSKYVFEILPKATKAQVREAVERAFEVNVTKVNIIKIPGEQRRLGAGRKFRTANVKKAVVTLRQGDTIQIFEGA